MNDQYINELIHTLEQTRVYIENDTELNYDTGMRTLVECFPGTKRRIRRFFLSEMVEVRQ